MFKTTSPNGFHVTFDNGCTVSVQWNLGNYCSGRDLRNNSKAPRESGTVEVAAWDATGKYIKLERSNSDDVAGWQSPEQVAKIMARIAKRKAVGS